MASGRRAKVSRQLQSQVVMEVFDPTVGGLLDQGSNEHRSSELDNSKHGEHCVVVNGADETMVNVNGECICVGNIFVVRSDVD